MYNRFGILAATALFVAAPAFAAPMAHESRVHEGKALEVRLDFCCVAWATEVYEAS